MGPVRGRGVEAGLYDLAGKLKVALVGRSGPPLQAPNPALSPPEITVSQPVLRKTIEWDEYTGRFDAVEAVDVRARVSGYLAKVNFTDGQEVKAGDLLFEIDPRPFERALDQATAQLDEAKVRVSNAGLDVERGRPLLKSEAISRKTFDDRENLVREATAAVKVAEARVKTAELELSFCRITAPISGRISRTLVTRGNFVSGGGNDTGNTILTTIVTQDPIYIYFDVSENNALKYQRLAQASGKGASGMVGAAVGVGLPDEEHFPHAGKLDFIENRLDAGTGTLRARAIVPNTEGLSRPACLRACGCRARQSIRRCCYPTKRSTRTRHPFRLRRRQRRRTGAAHGRTRPARGRPQGRPQGDRTKRLDRDPRPTAHLAGSKNRSEAHAAHRLRCQRRQRLRG